MGLSELQTRVARSFFELPESEGFALAGGGALVVQQLVDRITQDLDLFVADRSAPRRAADALQVALEGDGLACERVRDHPIFVRFNVSEGDEATEVDIAHDHQWRPSVPTVVGPARGSEELAVDKLLALHGRALARDFVDVYLLQRRHGIEAMLRWAPEKDPGFSRYHLAEALGQMTRIPRTELEVDDATYGELNQFFAVLRAELVRQTVEG